MKTDDRGLVDCRECAYLRGESCRRRSPSPASGTWIAGLRAMRRAVGVAVKYLSPREADGFPPGDLDGAPAAVWPLVNPATDGCGDGLLADPSFVADGAHALPDDTECPHGARLDQPCDACKRPARA